MKDLDSCISSNVSNSILEIIKSFNLDSKNCLYWLTDNITYMSGSKVEVVVNFNKKFNGNTIRIPYSLHIIHITATTFNNITFDKINSLSGLFLNFHSFNIINLAYHLYNGYNKSNKNNSLNIKNETINKLYKVLLDIDFNKYQKPITSH